MTGERGPMNPIYHSGEIAVQERAGARPAAERVGRSIATAIPYRAWDFVVAQPMAIVGTVATDGRVWASLLTGAPGFMRVVNDRTLKIETRAVPGDPLGDNLQRAKDVGVLIIELSTRRRMRLNGKVKLAPDGALSVHAEQVYSNCPKYIQAREWQLEPGAMSPPAGHLVGRSRELTAYQQRWITRADTFFIASFHPQACADASHRGGAPGFVRVKNSRRLAWEDYPGNGMFQTLGNIHSYPRAGLLFVDFETGDILQVTGAAAIAWDETSANEPVGAARSIELEIDEVVQIADATRLRWRFLSYSPFNPS